MSRLDAYREFLASRGLSLEALGLQERALSRSDALHAVGLVDSAGVPILGGDVYVETNGQITSAYANWYAEPRDGESKTSFVARTYADTRTYISRYPNPPNGEPLFVLVTGDEHES